MSCNGVYLPREHVPCTCVRKGRLGVGLRACLRHTVQIHSAFVRHQQENASTRIGGVLKVFALERIPLDVGLTEVVPFKLPSCCEWPSHPHALFAL